MKHVSETSLGAYSIIVSIIMIGFLLVLTTSTLNLVLQEMQDGRGRQDYMKAYAGAEASLELALLRIKEEGYGYNTPLEDSKILGTEIKEATVWYTFDGKVTSFSWTLDAYETDIIPLFWIDNTEHSIREASLSAPDSIAWNIVWENGGISGVGSFHPLTETWEKSLIEISGNQDFSFVTDTKVKDFLALHTGSYLVVYNTDLSSKNYTFTSPEFFTKPRSSIESSAKVGKYTQNLETLVDNTEFLWMLKYSIYSWE